MVLKEYIIWLVFVLLGFAVYSNTFDAPFYSDDFPNIVQNQAIRIVSISDLNVDRLLQSTLANRVIPNVSFALNYLSGKYNVFGYHLVNICLHILNGILLFFLLRHTLKFSHLNLPGRNILIIAFYSSLLWFVHPVQTQAVTYIVQRMTSMAAMFYLLTMLCYIRWRISALRLPASIWLFFSVMFSIFGFLSKEITFTLPLVLLLYECLFFQNGSFEWIKKNLYPIVTLIVLSLIVAYVSVGGDTLVSIPAAFAKKEYTMIERVLTESRVIMFYLSLIAFPLPSRLSLIHDFSISTSVLSPLTTLFSLGVLAVMFLAAMALFRRNRLASFVILWFLINLLIESTVIPLEIVFEHRLYLPTMFLFLLPVLFADRLLKNRYVLHCLLILSVLVLSFAAYQRNSAWANPDKFYTGMIRVASESYRVHYNYGVYLKEQGDLKGAAEMLQKALALKPDDVFVQYDLGMVSLNLAEYEQAVKHLEKVLQKMPGFFQVYYALGFASKKMKEYDRAEKFLLDGLVLKPDFLEAHEELAQLYIMRNKFGEAIYHYRKILDISGEENFQVQVNLGNCFARLGNFEKAVEHFSLALEMNPTHKMLLYNIDLARKKLKTPDHK